MATAALDDGSILVQTAEPLRSEAQIRVTGAVKMHGGPADLMALECPPTGFFLLNIELL